MTTDSRDIECVKCGSSNESSASGCSVCGADLNVNSSSEAQSVSTQSASAIPTEQPSSEQGWGTSDASTESKDAQPVRLVLASRWQRFGGYAVDCLTLSVLQTILAIVSLRLRFETPSWFEDSLYPVEPPSLFGILAGWFILLVGPLLYFWLMTGLNDGRTLGKMAVGTKVVNEDGESPSLLTAFMREVIGKFISRIVLGLGFIWILFDPKFQGWHDKIASTYVIKAR